MRRPLIAGNWKMNLDRRGSLALAGAVRAQADLRSRTDVALFVPFVYLDEVSRVLAGSSVALGGQNLCAEPQGAFTGEISGAMLRDVGCRMVLVGHSERRALYGEGLAVLHQKLAAALRESLQPVLCVGETLAERKAGKTENVVREQLLSALEGLNPADARHLTLAYEPVWAIGTGLTASAAQAGEVHSYLRGLLCGRFDEALAEATRILYGGSVKPDNIEELLRVPGVDGALVGGAALQAAAFNTLIDAAAR